jgi:hypothetical protein
MFKYRIANSYLATLSTDSLSHILNYNFTGRPMGLPASFKRINECLNFVVKDRSEEDKISLDCSEIWNSFNVIFPSIWYANNVGNYITKPLHRYFLLPINKSLRSTWHVRVRKSVLQRLPTFGAVSVPPFVAAYALEASSSSTRYFTAMSPVSPSRCWLQLNRKLNYPN